MHKFKKLLTYTMLVALLFTTPIPVLADETDVNITIEQTNEEAVFSAFKILNATNSGEKYAYTLNEKYAPIIKEVTGLTEETAIIDYIANLDADGIRAFADTMYEKIVENDLSAEGVSQDSKFSSMEQGYYLIAETTIGTQPDSASLIMLDTLGEDEIIVKTKEDIPSLEKKVQEINDSTNATAWQDGADFDIGDSINFQLTSDLPSNYYAYKTYNYIIHDTLSAGLTYNNDAKVYVVNGETKTEITEFANFTPENGDSITVTFADLKTINTITINADSKIVVEYSATLNENANIGSVGNPNTANLEFSNNPYDEGTGETPDDKVVIFTYETIVNKVDKDGASLEGAGFTLYKYDADSNDYIAVGEEIIGEGVTTFDFVGLDAGQYKLVETTVPAGYNKANDIVFTITAEYDTESAEPQLINLKVNDEATGIFSIKKDAGTLTTDVTNISGTQLPETGGIGTTLFYLVGGLLVAGTSVVLITRKRMSKTTED